MTGPALAGAPLRAVLFDRDGTLVVDVPYNGDPARVLPMPGARQVVATLRAAGVLVGVVTNQSAIARGMITHDQADAVNARVDELVGPFDDWRVCPHGTDDGCRCRKPQPGMVLDAAAALGVDPQEIAVVGDIGADLGAATAAGARGVLVPTPATRAEEVRAAELVAPDLAGAVALLIGKDFPLGPARSRPSLPRLSSPTHCSSPLVEPVETEARDPDELDQRSGSMRGVESLSGTGSLVPTGRRDGATA